MKTLNTYITDVKIIENFNDINNEIICESLNSSYLQTVAKQMKKVSQRKDTTFGAIFGRIGAAWDKITDNDFEEYKAGDKLGIKKVRSILSNTQKFVNAIVLLKSKDNNEFDSMICYMGKVNFKIKKWTWVDTGNGHYDYDNVECVDYDFSGKYLQKYAKEDCENHDFLYLDLSKYSIQQIHNDRYEAKQNMVLPGNIYYYKRLAEENVERYRKIIAQNKARANTEDNKMAKDIKELLDDLTTLTSLAFKNPDKFISIQFKLSSCIEHVYSTTQYNRHGTTGYNGLLVLYNRYLNNHISIAKDGGYSYQQKAQTKLKNDIEHMIAYLSKAIDDIKNLI